MKYQREKISDPQNTHEKKSWTHKIPTRKNFEPMKYPHDNKFWIHNIPTRKSLGPSKCPREKIWDPRNTHEEKFRTYEEAVAREPRNLAH